MDQGFPETTTHPSLLVRLRDVNDRQAWTLFVEIYGPVIFSYCRRRNLQVTDASDVSQEVFSILSQSLPTFEYQTERGRFRDWLGTITHREIIRFWKRQERGKREQASSGLEALDSATETASWDEHFHTELLQHAILRIRDSFEEESWTIFERLWLHGEPPEQVAQSLGVRIGSVYVAKSRILKRLRAEVLMLCDDWPFPNLPSE